MSEQFKQHAHLQKLQECFGKAQTPAETHWQRHQIQLQHPHPSQKREAYPWSRNDTDERHGAEHSQPVWASNPKKLSYPQPELEVVLRHISQQPCLERAFAGVSFGFCIRWIVNWAAVSRRKHPGRRFLVTKIN